MHSQSLDASNHPSGEPSVVLPDPTFVPAALPEMVRYWRLRVQLQHEQCLNQLSWRFNNAITAYLETELKSRDGGSYVAELFQTLVYELSRGLMGATVVVACPIGDDRTLETSFVVRHLAPDSVQQLAQESSWLLPSGKPFKFQLDEVLTQEDLQYLHAQLPESIWQIRDGQDLLGWLLVRSPLAPHKLNRLDTLLYSLNAQLVDRGIQQCVTALRQLKLVRAQGQQQHELIARNQELTQTNRLKSEFLANTSHEIRTPLSSILGFTHLLREQGYGATNLRHQEYLDIILTSGQHLLALINDILDLSKIEANQLDLQREPINVHSICQMVLALVREQASDKGLELCHEIAPQVTTLVADALRLKQMLFNLLSNALKFTLQGSVGLQVTSVDGFLRFSVWDTGVGISADQQALLFRPYAQIANAAAGRTEGTGLGLALTQKLAELHGGWVEVSSELNQGSRFSIMLPLMTASVSTAPGSVDASRTASRPVDRLRTDAADRRSRTIARSSNQHSPHSRSPGDRATPAWLIKTSRAIPEHLKAACLRSNHLMLVEDNPHNAKLLLTYLSKLGYELTWVQTGLEMWQALERCLPALILMDIHLPRTDGLTLIRQLQADSRYRQIPVIAQTAMAMTGDREICLEAGAVDYVSKPIDLTHLATLIARHVRADRG